MLNAIAPVAVQGTPTDAFAGYLEMGAQYPFSFSLTASQVLTNQIVSIYIEADFLLQGLTFVNDGAFGIRFYDGSNTATSTDFIRSGCLPNTAGDPFPFFPEIFYPAGGRIVIDIEDLSVATNTGQLLFIGSSRYKLNR